MPTTAEDLITQALDLRHRVDLAPTQLFRLVGVGLSNFPDTDPETNPAPNPDHPAPLLDDILPNLPEL